MDKKASFLFEKISGGDRVALGKAITLVESDKETDRNDAIQLLALCETSLKVNDKSIRFAISGSPGVGKSTLIETIGLKAIAHGHKVGVITIDPSSSISHGSILGDKSRMTELSTSKNAFIRSTAAGSVLGGMGRRTYEMMTLVAAAGYDLIFVETVGVGQSEHMAWQMTDGFILVLQPGGGDELQGIKRGITELADIILVNKADGEMEGLAQIAKGQYQNALHYFSSLREGWEPKIATCSALKDTGIDDVWDILRLYQTTRLSKGLLKEARNNQKLFWLTWSLGITANQLLMNHPAVKHQVEKANETLRGKDVSLFLTEFEIENTMKDLLNPLSSKEIH
ncbi:MAG: methylmalonyl Co-A mutase-associated GTPase MeaB [Saprospiraceae bacterium]|nr:methylmalonyl Co-A mutase-associated GTPase MeaB [Saprospiraceae bacterium]